MPEDPVALKGSVVRGSTDGHQGPARVAIEFHVVLEDLSPILEALARREGAREVVRLA